MTGINHMLAGGIIGAAVANPVAIPIAFASHFVLDALPHYGIDPDEPRMNDWVWKVDAVIVSAFVVFLIFGAFDNKALIALSAFAAVSPDMAWVYRFVVKERFGKRSPPWKKNRFNTFHADIQKYESSKLLWVEIGVFALFTTIALQTVY